jgi:molybdopterin synthase catalytic subunit
LTVAQITASISAAPLDIAGLIRAAGDPGAGGTGVFVGTVRDTGDEEGRAVIALEYDVHPSLAEKTLTSLARQAADKWDLTNVVAVHRTGRCEVGDPTVVLVCAAPHRAAALDACRWLIDEIKTSVPIWKKELYADGSGWV